VVYGPLNNLRYTATGCTITAAPPQQSQVQCLTAPGTGTGHWIQITCGGQVSLHRNNILLFLVIDLLRHLVQISPPYPAGISYAPASILSFTGAGATSATSGNQIVTITGTNFGPATAWTNQNLKVKCLWSVCKCISTLYTIGVVRWHPHQPTVQRHGCQHAGNGAGLVLRTLFASK
jgi:hypothetical protein